MPNISDVFTSKYLKASDLKGHSVNVTIDRVEMEPVGQSREMKPVLYFVGKEKGMVLNKTCANKIMQLTESPVTEEWNGTRIQLYPTETSFQGEQVDCIRIRNAPAESRKVIPPPPPVADFDDSDEPPF